MRDEPNVGLKCLTARSSDTIKGVGSFDAAEQITVSFGESVTTCVPGGIAGAGIGFVQISARSQTSAAPPPPPETFSPYSKRMEESGEVLAMIGLLVADLDMDLEEHLTAPLRNTEEENKKKVVLPAKHVTTMTERKLQKNLGDAERDF